MSLSSSQFKQFAIVAARSADAKKGTDISVLDLRRARSGLSDYLLLVNANSLVHLRTLADAIEGCLDMLGVAPLHRDGARESQWVALDYGGLLIHIFLEKARGFYSLERLWLEARQVPWEPEKAKVKKPKPRRAGKKR